MSESIEFEHHNIASQPHVIALSDTLRVGKYEIPETVQWLSSAEVVPLLAL